MDIDMTRLHACFFAFLAEQPFLLRSEQKKCATHPESRIIVVLYPRLTLPLLMLLHLECHFLGSLRKVKKMGLKSYVCVLARFF